MYRKQIILLIIFVALIGCSNHEQVNPMEETEIKPEEQITIAFAHKSVNSYFYTIMNEAVKRAVEEKGWNYETSIADYDAMRQNQQILNFIEKKPSAIITTAIDSIAIESVVKQANKKGIPICTIDTNAAGGGLTLDVSFDNYHAGQLAAQEIVKRLILKYGEARGTVFNAYGKLSSNAWRLRKEGFESVIQKYPNITYIAEATEGQPQNVKEKLSETLKVYGNIDAVHASSEHPGRGLVEVLQETGRWYKVSDPRHIIMVTIDAEPYFVDLIQKGYADAAISQDVIAYGSIVIDLLDRYVFQGKDIPTGKYKVEDTYWKECDIHVENQQAKIIIPPYVVDSNNCIDTTHWAYKAKYIWGFQFNQ